jgi:hypothetical protein
MIQGATITFNRESQTHTKMYIAPIPFTEIRGIPKDNIPSIPTPSIRSNRSVVHSIIRAIITVMID